MSKKQKEMAAGMEDTLKQSGKEGGKRRERGGGYVEDNTEK